MLDNSGSLIGEMNLGILKRRGTLNNANANTLVGQMVEKGTVRVGGQWQTLYKKQGSDQSTTSFLI